MEKLNLIHDADRRDAIIPDAYQVKITFTSLVSEVNNFIIPEMGSAGIDVSKKYDYVVTDLIKGFIENAANENQTRVKLDPSNTKSNQ
jgi:hypothetical protein